MANINKTHGGDCFALLTCIKSLCCTPQINPMLYVNYILITKSTGVELSFICENGVARSLSPLADQGWMRGGRVGWC